MASLTPVSPPAFRVTFTAGDLSASVATVTLYRTADGQTNVVRTAEDLGAVGGFTAFDAEAPVGVPVTYSALQFDSSGNQIGYTAAVTGTLDADEPIYAWLSDPLVETSAIRVVMTDSAGQTATRSIPGTVYRVGPTSIVLSGVETPNTDLDMGFYTESADDDVAVRALIANANGSVLIRTMPGFGALIPRALYCFAGKANPTYLDGNGSLWSNSVTEISPSTQGVVESKASWQDVEDTFATWADAEAAFLTWLDLEQAFDN